MSVGFALSFHLSKQEYSVIPRERRAVDQSTIATRFSRFFLDPHLSKLRFGSQKKAPPIG